ncbi:MAG: hypothetical protein V4662_11890 [Verrucomicrobiota bacterium]
MPAPALPSSSRKGRRIPTDAEMTSNARAWRDSVQWACQNIQKDLGNGNRMRETAALWSKQLFIKRGLRMSPDRLRHKYGEWLVDPEGALVNWSMIGKPPERRHLPDAIVAQFWGTYLKMADKASKDAAWRVIMQKLIGGEALNGGLTWGSLWLTLHPGRDLPRACPWNMHNPPKGWSLTSFAESECPSDLAIIAATKGIGAARALAAKDCGVKMDWASLRIGECYMIDDHDPDFYCWVQGQIVALRLIVLIEVRTRRVLAYVVRPRLVEEDGNKRSITHRDVMHLLAGWLFKFGVPRDFPSVLHMENAAATVSDALIEIMERLTGGRLSVDKTALYSGVVQKASFRQSGGTPTGKAPLESKFRLFDIELALIRGQKGRNFIFKPEEIDGRLQYTQGLLKTARELPDAERVTLAKFVMDGPHKLPFTNLREAHEEIAAAITRMDCRTWHEMEGFLTIHEFRTAADSSIFYPLTPEHVHLLPSEEKKVVQLFTSYPLELQNLMAGTGRGQWGRERVESSAECWERLRDTVKWAEISESAVFDMLLDAKPVEYRGHGVIRLTLQGQSMEYRGAIQASAGDKVVCRFNADNAGMIWVQDRAGRVLGSMQRMERVGFHDEETLRERVEFKEITIQHALQQVRMFEMNNPDAVREIQDNAETAALVSALSDRARTPGNVATIISETSDELVDAMTAGRRSTKRKPSTKRDSAASFLQNL